MTILFLSWAYPPMVFPRATQVARLAKHLRLRPLEIYCLAAQGDRIECDRDNESHFDLVRIPRGLPTRIMERLLPPQRRNALQKYDVDRFWWKKAARYIVSRRTFRADDVLVTFGQPMADHRAGLKIKRATGIRWVAHFSDPWVDNPFLPPGDRAIASGLEGEVIEAADALVFTSRETIDLVMAKYPDDLRVKTAVIPHAFKLTLYPEAKRRSGPLLVRYLGNLFAGRGPEPLFQALAILRWRAPNLVARLRVELIGEIPREMYESAALLELPAETVRFLPRVPYSESLALMRNADLLLNIDAPGSLSVFLPSKLVDYIGAGRPILGITPPGTACTLIKEIGGWVADPANPAAIADVLEKALENIERDRDAWWGNPCVRERFAAETVAAEFEKILMPLARQ